ncbi:MAG TPA: hypothetical protein VM100_01175, partial [Longimicrobiales bacterium]|nr:hypothetical protein [Longimicrobiales bacterium]
MHRITRLVLAGLVTPVLLHAQSTAYVIRNVQVVPMNGASPARHDVVVRGRLITDITAPGHANSAGAITIDGRGKFLMPGLIDSHVH